MCVHPPPKAEAASSNLAECANLFNGLQNFSIFFGEYKITSGHYGLKLFSINNYRAKNKKNSKKQKN